MAGAAAAEAALFETVPQKKTRWQRTVRLAKRNPTGAVAAVLLVLLCVIAVFAPIIATHDPFLLNSRAVLQPPSAENYMGTDNLGRDAYSRIIYGARISLYVGFLAVALSTGIGVPVGIISAFAGQKVDYVIQRFNDAMFAFPTIVLALAIVAALGKGITQVIIAVGVLGAPRTSRVVRASTLGVMGMPYIEAAKSIGAPSMRIMARHIMPNVFAPVVVLMSAGFGGAILAEASLSFLGLGTPAPTPSWGAMLSGAAQQFVRSAPWLAIFPGIAISLAVFAFNLFGDSLRDILDPRLRGA